jgi:hypothetical protein
MILTLTPCGCFIFKENAKASNLILKVCFHILFKNVCLSIAKNKVKFALALSVAILLCSLGCSTGFGAGNCPIKQNGVATLLPARLNPA